MIEAIERGGVMMTPIAVLGGLGCATVPVAILVSLLSKGRRMTLGISLGLCAVAVLIVLLGAVGYLVSMRTVSEVLTQIEDPHHRHAVLSVGRAEALTPVGFALWTSIAPLGAGLSLLGLGWVRFHERKEA